MQNVAILRCCFVNFCKQRQRNEQRIITHACKVIVLAAVAVEVSLIREIKFDVYGKRQTPKIKLLPSVFSSLYIRIKIFVFAVNSKRHLSIFV